MSRRAYAKSRKLNEASVRRAISSGRLDKAVRADGMIDPAIADREWAANTNPSKPRARFTGNPHHHRDVSGVKTPAGLETDGNRAGAAVDPRIAELLSSVAASRAMRESIAARREQLKLDEEMGRLVDSANVRAIVFGLVRRSRDAVLASADRVAQKGAMRSIEELRRIARAEADAVCEELSKVPELSSTPPPKRRR